MTIMNLSLFTEKAQQKAAVSRSQGDNLQARELRAPYSHPSLSSCHLNVREATPQTPRTQKQQLEQRPLILQL